MSVYCLMLFHSTVMQISSRSSRQPARGAPAARKSYRPDGGSGASRSVRRRAPVATRHLIEKAGHQPGEGGGPLEVHGVAGIGNDLEPGAWNRGHERPAERHVLRVEGPG